MAACIVRETIGHLEFPSSLSFSLPAISDCSMLIEKGHGCNHLKMPDASCFAGGVRFAPPL
jgi:hypothetical protein